LRTPSGQPSRGLWGRVLPSVHPRSIAPRRRGGSIPPGYPDRRGSVAGGRHFGCWMLADGSGDLLVLSHHVPDGGEGSGSATPRRGDCRVRAPWWVRASESGTTRHDDG